MANSKDYFDFLHSLETDANFCYKYLEKNSLNKEHPTYKKCLETISKDAAISLMFAENILKGRFQLAEPTIANNAEKSYWYAKAILKGRFSLGENAIATNPAYSFDYAKFVIHGRFELGENAIAEDENLAYKYATEIIMGQLPEEMHNKMLAKRIAS